MTHYDEKALEAAAKAIFDSIFGPSGNTPASYKYLMRACNKAAPLALTAYHAHESVQREEAEMVLVTKEPTEEMIQVIAREWCQIAGDFLTCLDCHCASGDEQRCGAFDNAKAGLEKLLQAAQGGKGGEG